MIPQNDSLQLDSASLFLSFHFLKCVQFGSEILRKIFRLFERICSLVLLAISIKRIVVKKHSSNKIPLQPGEKKRLTLNSLEGTKIHSKKFKPKLLTKTELKFWRSNIYFPTSYCFFKIGASNKPTTAFPTVLSNAEGLNM